METLAIAYRLVSWVSMFVVPLSFAILLYIYLRKYSRVLAHIVAFVFPPSITFYFCHMVMAQSFDRMVAENSGRPGCGLPALGALIILFAGTIAQVIASVTVQTILFVRDYIRNA